MLRCSKAICLCLLDGPAGERGVILSEVLLECDRFRANNLLPVNGVRERVLLHPMKLLGQECEKLENKYGGCLLRAGRDQYLSGQNSGLFFLSHMLSGENQTWACMADSEDWRYKTWHHLHAAWRNHVSLVCVNESIGHSASAHLRLVVVPASFDLSNPEVRGRLLWRADDCSYTNLV
jgi:hypothetical protein